MINPNYDIATIAAGRHYLVATDGARNGTPGQAGWGVLISLREQGVAVRQSAFAAAYGDNTHIRAEMNAVIQGISKLADRSVPIIVITDNKMIVEAMTQGWFENWRANDWWNGTQPRLNGDLWQELDGQLVGRTVAWQWVKGHTGHPLNSIVDRLAFGAAKGNYRGKGKSVRDQHPGLFF